MQAHIVLVELGLVGGERIGHGVARQVEGIGRVPRPLAYVARPGAETQAIAAEQAAEVIHRRQRTGVSGHVLQAVALKVGILGHLGIGIGVAADQAPALAELPGQVEFDTPRADFPCVAVDRLASASVEVRDQYVALGDIEQRQGTGEAARHVELGPQLPGLTLLRRHRRVQHHATGQRGDAGVGLERLAVAAIQRQLVIDLVDDARMGHPGLAVTVGIGLERATAAGVLVVLLVTRASDQDPVLIQVQCVLYEQGVSAQLVGLVAVAGAHRGALHFLAVDRVQVAEGGLRGLTDQIAAKDLAVFVVDAEQQVVLHAGQFDIAIEAQGGELVAAHGVVGAIDAARQRALGLVHAGHANLAGIVGLAVEAVAEVQLPVIGQLVVDLQAVQVGAPFHVVERLVQAAGGRNVQRVAVAAKCRAAVERVEEFAVLIGQHHLGVLAEPGQRRRHQRLAVHAEVAPIVLVLVVNDQAVGEVAVAQRAGAVETTAAAILAAAIGGAAHGQGVVLLQLRALADHVDHPARVLDAVQQRGRALEYFDPLGAGIEAAALHQRHAVAHDRAVAVVTEATFHHRVGSATEVVALGDAADVGQGVVEVARGLVADDLGRHHVDRLGDVLGRALAAHDRGTGGWLIAVAVHLRGHRGGLQVEGARGIHRFERQGACVEAAPSQATVAQQLLQGLFGAERAVDGRGLHAGQFEGVDHALASGTAERVEGLSQRLARLGERVQLALLGGHEARGSGDGRARCKAEPEGNATRGELHGR